MKVARHEKIIELIHQYDIDTQEGQKINRYTPSEDQDVKSGKKGKKVGIAYELDNGEIIYVPEE